MNNICKGTKLVVQTVQEVKLIWSLLAAICTVKLFKEEPNVTTLVVQTVNEVKLIFGNRKTEKNDLIAGRSKIISKELVIVSLQIGVLHR